MESIGKPFVAFRRFRAVFSGSREKFPKFSGAVFLKKRWLFGRKSGIMGASTRRRPAKRRKIGDVGATGNRRNVEKSATSARSATGETSKNRRRRRRRRRGSASNVRYFNASGGKNQSKDAIFAEILSFY